MKQTWRWFGPDDAVSLWDIRQAGVEGIVTALYDVPPGTVWTPAAIARRQHAVAHHPDGTPSTLTWDVVESLPVSEEIKTGGPLRDAHIAAWIESLQNLAAAGIAVVCYNFMPILDWTRTDLAARRPNGARALRFDLTDFAAFDLHVLARPDAATDYTPATITAARQRFEAMGSGERDRLGATILAGLPGAVEHWTLDSFRARLDAYKGIDADGLRANLATFLEQVVPVAEALGLRLCCHPDDPPWPLFGLPRIVSTEADYFWLVNAAPSPANGVTFCTGSLGARADNDLPGMAARLGPHIHFLHLRNVRREDDTVPGSFFEDDHLEGSTDMIAVMHALVAEETRRKATGRADYSIPMRPDHGHALLDDVNRPSAPGYTAIGRLRGLAELRGVLRALEHGA